MAEEYSRTPTAMLPPVPTHVFQHRVLPLLGAAAIAACECTCRAARLLSRAVDQPWRICALRARGSEFWQRAASRPRHISRPLGSFRAELHRMRRFEMRARQRFTNAEYYALWRVLDFRG